VVQQPLNKYLNPNWKNWEWVNIGGGISKPMPMNPVPDVAGNITGSVFSEVANGKIGERLEKFEKK
jgi:filamentous hemagglutinin